MSEKFINLTLNAGGLSGVRIVVFDPPAIEMLVIPKNKLEDAKRIFKEYDKPATYFLIGKKTPELPKLRVYTGMADQLFKRVIQHKDKPFWHEIVVFTGPRGFTFTSAKYLESRCMELVKENKDCHQENKQESKRPSNLDNSNIHKLDQFLEEIKLLFRVFRYPIFENTPEELAAKPRLESRTRAMVDKKHPDYTGTKPRGIRIGNERFRVSNWKQVLITVCNYLVDKYPRTFEEKALSYKGSKWNYFSRSKNELSAPNGLKNGLYVETNFNANTIYQKARGILNLFESNEILKVELD